MSTRTREHTVNFSAGPAAMPTPALEHAREELLNFEGAGASILELSHRGKEYGSVHEETLSLLRELIGVPDTHTILLLQGGASHQFAMVPLNLLHPHRPADYVLTGVWAEKAFAEASLVGPARIAATTKQSDAPLYRRVPRDEEIDVDGNASYLHVTLNNTIYGTQFHYVPAQRGAVPLVADASSDILSRPMDISRFGVIYAGAQKNLGPTGISVVIIRKDLIERAGTNIPKILRYAVHAAENSLYNTIPTFAVYLTRNVLRWVKANGGALGMEKRNRRKAELLYSAVDAEPDFYRAPVEHASRSWMNVVFRLPTDALDAQFIRESAENGFIGLKGHRLAGGVRASLYNAVSESDVEKLVSFMREFRKRN